MNAGLTCGGWARRALAVGLVLLADAVPADPPTLLHKAIDAEATVAHRGVQQVQVFASGNTVTSTVVLYSDGARHTRRLHRSGPRQGLEVVDDGRWEWDRQPGSDLWVPTVALVHPSAEADLDHVHANYSASSSDGPKIAGRATLHVRLTPRNQGNPPRELWLDKATGLPLRVDLFNRDGKLVGRTTYSEISFAKPAAKEVSLPAGARCYQGTAPGCLTRVDSPAELTRRLGRQPMRPRRLPAGYMLRETYLKACRRGGWSPVTVFSDGLNAFTVMEPAGSQGRGWRWGWRRRCQTQTNLLQVVVRTRAGGREVVLVGDLAEAQLRATAESLAP